MHVIQRDHRVEQTSFPLNFTLVNILLFRKRSLYGKVLVLPTKISCMTLMPANIGRLKILITHICEEENRRSMHFLRTTISHEIGNFLQVRSRIGFGLSQLCGACPHLLSKMQSFLRDRLSFSRYLAPKLERSRKYDFFGN